MAHNSHTCDLRCILCQVHALTQNIFYFICHCHGKLCEAIFDELSGLPVEAAEVAKIAHSKTVCDL